MTTTSMSVRTLVATDPHIPVNVSRLIRGPHGIGKSSIVRQLKAARELESGVEYTLIDKRLSQMTEGDMIGLPSVGEMMSESVTKFNPPDWYMQACRKPCFLFLDEMNRATHEVMQAAFQIVLDREMNGFKLHPQTYVYAAVNTGSTYSVNDMDPALLDRFWTIDLEPDVEDWLAWARGAKIDFSIIEFINGNKNWLDPPKSANFSAVLPSRRSWERLDASLKSANVTETPENPLFYNLALGFVGTEAAIAFQTFATDTNARVTAEDVLERYTTSTKKSAANKVRDKVKRMPIDKQTSTIDSVAMYLVERWKLGPDGTSFVTPWEKRHAENLHAFLLDMTDELKLGLWTKITEYAVDNLELLKVVHKALVADVLLVFGVELGNSKASQPKIPEFFQKKLNDDAQKRQQAASTAALEQDAE